MYIEWVNKHVCEKDIRVRLQETKYRQSHTCLYEIEVDINSIENFVTSSIITCELSLNFIPYT